MGTLYYLRKPKGKQSYKLLFDHAKRFPCPSCGKPMQVADRVECDLCHTIVRVEQKHRHKRVYIVEKRGFVSSRRP